MHPRYERLKTSTNRSIEPSGVSAARLRPLRKSVPSMMSLRSRERLPLFEKSNVLILYVAFIKHTCHLLDESTLRGPTGSGRTFFP